MVDTHVLLQLTGRGEKSGAKGKAGGSAPTPAPTGLVSYGPALRKFHEMKVVRDIKEVMCTITQVRRRRVPILRIK